MVVSQFEQSTSWISPISYSSEHSFWSRTSLRQNGCLWWIWSKEMMCISFTIAHLLQSWFRPPFLFFFFISLFFRSFFFPFLFSFFPSFSYSPIYKSDFFSISPSYNVTGVTLILPPWGHEYLFSTVLHVWRPIYISLFFIKFSASIGYLRFGLICACGLKAIP